MGTPLLEPAPPVSLTMLAYAYVKSLDFFFHSPSLTTGITEIFQ